MPAEPSVSRPAAPPTVLKIFDDRRRATPGLPALEYRGRQMSYDELGRAADRTAARLARLSPGASVVGVCTDRSFRLPLAILATLRAGAAYLPLDLAYPPARLGFMMRDSGVSVLLTQRTGAERLPVPSGTRVVLLDTGEPSGPLPEAGFPCATADDLAYVMYTSGSTGVPKGVAMPHGPMANLITWQHTASSCGEGSRTLQFSAASFDASFQEMFSTWACGGCLVLVDEDVRRDAHRLLRFVDEQRVNRLFMPFVALQALARAAVEQGFYPSSLKEVITAGEQLFVTPALRRFFTELADASLENQYGPSETHIVTALRLGAEPADWPERPAIGQPVEAARIHILAGDGAPLPAGATGEIAVAGPVLARGYLNRPGLSAGKFTPDPLGPPGARLYRTGDIGRMDVDGNVHFLGRDDGQVKIRGHRVELGEVETAVRALPGVADAAVVVNDSPTAGRRLIAYLIVNADPPDDIRLRLAGGLPDHMIPTAFVTLEGFPLTPSGKVDRRALAARAVTVRGSGHGATRDPVEYALVRLWEETLDVTGIAVDDDFFELGGTSLLAAVLTTRLNADFGVRAELETFLRQPTVAAMSDWIRQERVAVPVPPTGAMQ